MARNVLSRMRGWDVMLFVILVVVMTWNAIDTPGYASVQNQVNLLQLGIERSIVVLAMAFVIISGEIDLSVASMMALSAAVAAALFGKGAPMEVGIVAALAVGVLCGLFNGFWVAVVGLPSLAVTLATLIGFRGLATMLIEDRSIGRLPAVVRYPRPIDRGGTTDVQHPALRGDGGRGGRVAPLHRVRTHHIRDRQQQGRSQVLGRPAGETPDPHLRHERHRRGAGGAPVHGAAGSARASTATGFELDIITVVLLGGVSIFGGSGSMLGVVLSTFLVLNLRNGLSLAGVEGNTQTGIVGALLILSVLLPNVASSVQDRRRRQTAARVGPGAPPPPAADLPKAVSAP